MGLEDVMGTGGWAKVCQMVPALELRDPNMGGRDSRSGLV